MHNFELAKASNRAIVSSTPALVRMTSMSPFTWVSVNDYTVGRVHQHPILYFSNKNQKYRLLLDFVLFQEVKESEHIFCIQHPSQFGFRSLQISFPKVLICSPLNLQYCIMSLEIKKCTFFGSHSSVGSASQSLCLSPIPTDCLLCGYSHLSKALHY
jgi:hypothetical protein